MNKNKYYAEHLGMPLNDVRRHAVNKLNELIYLNEITLQRVEKCFCGSIEFELLSRYDRFGLPFGTKICTACGLIVQTINIKEESMPRFYDEIYWELIYGTNQDLEYSTQLEGVDDFIPFISSKINLKSKKAKILEIGVGQGNRIAKLASHLENHHDLELYGCDYSTEALKNAQKKGIIPIRGGMSQCLNYGPVDILLMSHVFEHFVNLEDSLNLIDKLTKENTLIYVEVPGVIDLANKREYMYDYQDYSVLAHIHNFSLSTLTNIFSTHEYNLIKGSEYIRATFSKNVRNSQPVSNNPFSEIMDALKNAKEKHIHFMKKVNHPARVYVKGLVNAALRKK
jgi:ubiquinone/menaquinone biosynthesis C-methylase UbiE